MVIKWQILDVYLTVAFNSSSSCERCSLQSIVCLVTWMELKAQDAFAFTSLKPPRGTTSVQFFQIKDHHHKLRWLLFGYCLEGPFKGPQNYHWLVDLFFHKKRQLKMLGHILSNPASIVSLTKSNDDQLLKYLELLTEEEFFKSKSASKGQRRSDPR